MGCGEYSISQLVGRFGWDGALTKLKRLRLVWISCVHASYHAGLFELIRLRHKLRCNDSSESLMEPLLVLGPKPLQHLLLKATSLERQSYFFIDCLHTENA